MSKEKEPIQTQEKLINLQEKSQKQKLPEQKAVFSVSSKIRKRVRNLPDPTRPPLGYDEHKAFDRVFPYIRLPRFHPPGDDDTVIFNAPEFPVNQLILGDNLEILRTLPSNFIDFIYIDPPFFSGRQYNVIWGDSNEVRTFYDIWEGGIDSYLIWLNARLWEMRRVLKSTGSICVHCDWHASHYIKSEMDKIFGYENFRNNIVWCYKTREFSKRYWNRKHDDILLYSKTNNYKFNWDDEDVLEPYSEVTIKKYKHKDEKGYYRLDGRGIKGSPIRSAKDVDPKWEKEHPELVVRDYLKKGYAPSDYFIMDIINQASKERIGYPTQKPESLLTKIIKASSDRGDVVADFFCGGGTTLAVAMELKRSFIGCDSSRVAVSVTLDRLVKIGEEMSGVMSNISKGNNEFQFSIQTEGVVEKVPNIEVSYHGVYPIDKFKGLDQESFIKFILSCYGASRNTAKGITHGYRPPRQQEPILTGPVDPSESIDAQKIKIFFDEIKSRLEPNKLVRSKIIGWRFSRQVIEYIKILLRYIEANNLPMELELIPLDSKNFRARILQRYPGAEEGEFFLRFSKSPVIGDIRVRKKGKLEYEFDAMDAFSTIEDGYLVNCQWDFDYQEGHFAADKDYILSRQKIKVKGQGEKFEAILISNHTFDKEGEYTIACKVQDNLAGEAILAKKIKVD